MFNKINNLSFQMSPGFAFFVVVGALPTLDFGRSSFALKPLKPEGGEQKPAN